MIFSQFTKDDIVTGRINQVSSGLFGSGDLQVSQSLFTTSSTQGRQLTGSSPYDVKNGQYYVDVYYDSEERLWVTYTYKHRVYGYGDAMVRDQLNNSTDFEYYDGQIINESIDDSEVVDGRIVDVKEVKKR